MFCVTFVFQKWTSSRVDDFGMNLNISHDICSYICSLKLPQLQYRGAACVNFSYHMYGKDIGRLNLLSLDNYNKKSVLWKDFGDKGNHWYTAEVDVRIDRSMVVS